MIPEPNAVKPRVFMMDLWATVPYYTAYLSRALLAIGIPVQIGSITYYLDRRCFRDRGLRLRPGCSDLVGRSNLPRPLRRVFKLVEGALNLSALSIRFLFEAPEILHIQFLPLLRSRMPMDHWFVRLCGRRGIRLVLTVHDLLPHDTGNEHREVYRALYAEMDGLICHSESIRHRLTAEFAADPEKVHVIPHGPFFYDLPEPEATVGRKAEKMQTVLWQGILFPYKGVDLLLDAWKEVEARSDRLRLRILGTGDPALLASLREQAERLGLREVQFDFRFCSAEELVAAYREAILVVYPYRAITTSGALATGLALQKAIVASDLPVFREALEEGKTALLVDPTNSVQLAEAMLKVADNPELATRLRQAVASLRFGDQSWMEIADATAKVYRMVLSPGTSSTRAERVVATSLH